MRLAKAPYLCERVPGGRVVSPPVRSLVGAIRAGGLAAVRPIAPAVCGRRPLLLRRPWRRCARANSRAAPACRG
jgi:hypothetical protein